MYKNILITHGVNGGIGETWGGWLQVEAEKRGLKIEAPEMPTKEAANYQDWAEIMDGYIAKDLVNEKTVLVAHSLGNLFWLRYSSEHDLQIGLFIGLAGFFNDHWAEIRPDLSIVVNNFKDGKIEIEKFKKSAEKRYLIYSDNDHLVPRDEMEKFGEMIGAEKIFIPGVGHLGRKAGIKKIPEILEIIDRNCPELVANQVE